MKINTKHQKKSNPVHIDICALSWLSKQSPYITISPKADGTYTELKYNNHIYQAEYIKELNLYLIFDTLTYPIKHSNTLINRYEWITKQHPIPIPTYPPVTSIDQLITIISENTTILKTYLSTTQIHQTHQIKWFPKITLQLNLSVQTYLSLLDTNIDDILVYKTDGWITTSLKHIGHLSKQIYKYKPKDELTVDVLYKDNQFYGLSDNNKLIPIKNIIPLNQTHIQTHIYRCHWDPLTNNFIPKDIRNDKLYPNSINIINEIETLHNNYWSATTLSKSPQYYYDDIIINKLDTNYIKYLQIQRDIFKTNITTIMQITNSKTIIDIGCGKGYILKFLKNKQLMLIDKDPSNIYILNNRYPNQNKYICANMNDYIPNQTQTYDLIIFNNSLHYINSLSTLINNITNYKYIYIHGLDKDMIPTTFNYNNIIITPNPLHPTYNFNYPWKSKTFDEPIISFSSLISLMELANWKIEKIFNHDNNDDKFIQVHKYILFKNNND